MLSGTGCGRSIRLRRTKLIICSVTVVAELFLYLRYYNQFYHKNRLITTIFARNLERR